MASRNLSDLCWRLQLKARELVKECIKAKLEINIYCTYRSAKEQDELYKIGRTLPGKKLTNCKGGESKHNKVDEKGNPASEAFDFVPMLNGKAQWENIDLYERVGEIGIKLGLKWGGKWKTIKDYPHFEI